MSHLSESEIQGLKNKAKNLRIDIIKMITKANRDIQEAPYLSSIC